VSSVCLKPVATTERSDIVKPEISDNLDLRFMQVQFSLLSGSNLPGIEIAASFPMTEFVTTISKSADGLEVYAKFEFNDPKVLTKKHGGMKILEIKSQTTNSAFARVLFDGPVAKLFCESDDVWWVNPSYLSQSGLSLTIRGTKSGLRGVRNNINNLVTSGFDVKLSAESSYTPEFKDMLPQKQRLVLDKAIEMGYYSRPRGCTQRDIAEVMNIKQATVSEHLQSAESKIINSIGNYSPTLS